MKITLVHISDIHIRTANDAILANARLIAAAAAPTAANSAYVFIVVTGDIAFSGKAEEYAVARQFLEGIRDSLLKECQRPLYFVVVPGNHDCNFDLDTGTRRNNLRHILSSPTPEIDESVIDSCLSVQKPFQDFRRTIETFSPKFDDGLWTTHIFDVAGKRIAFECLNLSWTSQLDEMPGKLVFPYDRYQHMPQDDVDVRIAVLHEPFNWLAQTSYRPLRNLVRKVSDIVFTGHEHSGNVGIVDDASSGRSAFVEGCAIQEHNDDLRSSAFNVVVIDTQTSRFSVSRYSCCLLPATIAVSRPLSGHRWTHAKTPGRLAQTWSVWRGLFEQIRQEAAV